ncbi:MAG: excinuclease ABC subunit UvrC [Crocinitomicaceae bacterium]|nr:excinuclease ABC subunit UvrC [Crocinitomicaceae bacterium]
MPSVKEEIQLKLKTLPELPGIYQYFDEKGKILYVGKAKNLKKRVSSYFTKTHDNGKTTVLVKQIVDIQYMVVDSEIDAYLLENNLIKKYRPKYNIQLKDDKTYPWICVKNEPFPRIFSTRNCIKDGSKYYGPYPSGKVMHTILDLIKDVYPLRTCSLDLSEKKIAEQKHKVCLEYHIGNCLAPCVGLQSNEVYSDNIQQIEHLLKGNISTAIQQLKAKMLDFSNQLDFEAAQKIKLKIDTLQNYQARSTVVSPTIHEVEVCTLIDDNDACFVNYLSINNGAIIHTYTLEIKKKLDESREELLIFALMDFRERFNSQSKEVLTDCAIQQSVPGITFTVPQKGDKKQLVDLSIRNAKYYKLEKLKQVKIVDPERHTQRILEQLKADFRLKELPIHIECFDNSNIQGTNPVSACVVFKDAKPSKKDYRHFNIKTVVGPDDFASMEEVVFRRYKRLKEENESLPQLIIIDGGKGQLGAALKSLERLELRGQVAIVGIAKRLEEIFFPGDSLPLYLDKRSESLKVVQFLRNEAHRFGITHHRNQRSKSAITSELDTIEGIGPKTKEQLMLQFKTISSIKKATKESLISCIGKAKGDLIFQFFHSKD